MNDNVLEIILVRAAATARSPKDALAVLNVVPFYTDTVLRTAVLSRGFLELQPALAVKHRHAQVLPHYPSYVLFGKLEKAIETATELGGLSMHIKLWEITGPSSIGRTIWINMTSLPLRIYHIYTEYHSIICHAATTRVIKNRICQSIRTRPLL
ncbi:hypothetical protein BC828DRAFT_381082 [Blastocladiella britannica]|nr:hypothetical protein BC828DRAFT_381082 [Blastocladiella britannica]